MNNVSYSTKNLGNSSTTNKKSSSDRFFSAQSKKTTYTSSETIKGSNLSGRKAKDLSSNKPGNVCKNSKTPTKNAGAKVLLEKHVLAILDNAPNIGKAEKARTKKSFYNILAANKGQEAFLEETIRVLLDQIQTSCNGPDEKAQMPDEKARIIGLFFTTFALNTIVDYFGLDPTKNMPQGIRDAIPANVNFEKRSTFMGGNSFSDLDPFREKSHSSKTKVSFGGQSGYYSFSLVSAKDRSVYCKHRTIEDGNKGCGRTADSHFDPQNPHSSMGNNQNDFSQIVEGGYVSISPAERTNKNSPSDMKPFFEAVQKEGIGLIVDLRTEGSSSIFRDYTDPQTLLCVGSGISGDRNRTSIAEGISRRTLFINGHRATHLRFTNIEDNTAPSINDTINFMRVIDSLKGRGVDTSKIVFHCNGGLGRAPTMLTLRTLWQVTQMAKLNEIGMVYDAANQNLMRVGDKLNLAAVLKNIVCQGTYARSTFMQSNAQLDAVVNFARYLANNQNVIFP
jgi:hypothetical protein